MDQARGKGADKALAAGVVLLGNPFVERTRVGEILFDLRPQRALVEISGGMARRVGHHFARQNMRRAHPVDAFLHDVVLGIYDPLAGFDQEIDDLGQRHIEQRRQFGARVDDAVHRDERRGEGHPQIARALGDVMPGQQFAAHEERRGNDRFRFCGPRQFSQLVHATPRT